MAIISTSGISANSLLSITNLHKTERSLADSIGRLSTGLKIVTASEDPSGRILANRFEAQVRGIRTASGNAEDAMSMVQVADSAVSDATQLLLRMRDLCIVGMNGATLTAGTSSALQAEFASLRLEIVRKASSTKFNGNNILSIALTSGSKIQIGPDNGAQYQLTFAIDSGRQLNFKSPWATSCSCNSRPTP